MDDVKKFLAIMGGVVGMIFLIGVGVFFVSLAAVSIDNQRYTNCVETANQIGLDPNDEKIEFIKQCVE